MGRKIPAKKHRGVKDPLQQQAKRLQSLKGKINAPPKDPDEQPVPRSLLRLFGARDAPRTKQPRRANLQRQSDSRGGKNPISQMKKLPGETGRSFSLRINNAIRALHGTIDQEDYPVELETEADDVKGERMEAQRRRRERKRKRAAAGAGAGAGAGAAAGAVAGAGQAAGSRARRAALKKQAKEQREAEAAQERRELVYERVRFGEQAHAPPALPPPRARRHPAASPAPPAPGAARPGRRELLLSRLLAPGGAGGTAGADGTGAGGTKARALPAAERMRRERARQDAVDAYRKIKAAHAKNRTQ